MLSLWSRNFTIYFVGAITSALGTTLAPIALGILIYTATGSTSDIAIVLAITTGMSLLGPFAGRVVDKANTRALLGWCNVARATSIAAFLFYHHNFGLNSFAVYGMTFANALLGIFMRPSMGSMMPRLVGLGNIVRANSLMGAAYSVTGVGGFVIGGMLVGIMGPETALFCNAASFLILGLAFFFIQEDLYAQESQMASGIRKAAAAVANRSTKEILLFIWQSGIVVMPVTIVFAGLATSPYRVEWPRLLTSMEAGFFFAFVAAGTAISSALIFRLKDRALDQKLFFLAIFALPVLTGLGYVAREPVMLLAIGAVLGFTTNFATSVSYSAIQSQLPQGARGRFFGVLQPLEQFPLFGVFLLMGAGVDALPAGVIFPLIAALLLCASFGVLWLVNKNTLFEKAVEAIQADRTAAAS
jgi:hypothetical protein